MVRDMDGLAAASPSVARLRSRQVPFLFYVGSALDVAAATVLVVRKPASASLVIETLARLLPRS